MAQDEREDRAHDASYRKLFGHPEILRELLEGFVGAEVTGELDLEQMEQVETTFIGPAHVRRQADMLWKIPRSGEGASALYLYVLVEFQSSIDALMPIRMMVYIGLLYEHLGKQDSSLLKRGGLPPVLPIVLYNGSSAWSAQTSVREMIGLAQDAALSRYQPELKFYLIDQGRLSEEALAQPDSVVATLFKLEHLQLPDAIRDLVTELAKIVKQRGLASIRDDLLLFLHELLKFTKLLTEQHIHSFEEADSMLKENIEEWRKQFRKEERRHGREEGREEGRQEGRQEGRLEATRQLLLKLVALKFGEDAGRAARVEALPLETLELAMQRILTATREDELFD